MINTIIKISILGGKVLPSIKRLMENTIISQFFLNNKAKFFIDLLYESLRKIEL